MENKLSTKQWIAIVVALLAVAAILLSSFRTSLSSKLEGVIKTSPEDFNEEIIKKENTTMTEANNWLPDFESIRTQGDTFRTEDLVSGEGKEAISGSEVIVNYEGFLTNGVKFDSSWDRGTPFGFVLGSQMVIEGWDKGVLGMKEGGVRMLVIPANMAYGDRDLGPIPANSTLVFIVELKEVK